MKIESHIKKEYEINNSPVKTTIKWFNRTKGFGFAVPIEDTCDAFIHTTILQDADINEIGEDAIISCCIVKGPKGALVTKVEELIDMGKNPEPISFRAEISDDEILDTMRGIVKWYRPEKGFGFIIPEDGQKDVFIHQSCLEKNDLQIIVPGQQVKMLVRSIAKGREVLEFELLNV